LKGRTLLALVAVCSLFAAGCGGSDDDDGGGGGGQSADTGQTKGAKAIDVSAMENAKGNVTYCTGKDTSGDLKEGVKEFNKANPELKAELLEFPESADEQRNQFIQRQRAKAADCDGFEADVVWTAEFASQKWLLDMTPYVDSRKDEFIPSTLETVKYDEKFWGVPKQTGRGLPVLPLRQVDQVPETVAGRLREAAKENDGIVYQGAPYEGLTVNFMELSLAAGGKVLSDDGKKAEINSPENLKALQFMVDGIKNGAAKKAVTTYMEEQARRSFEAGRATFMRNWPYAYTSATSPTSRASSRWPRTRPSRAAARPASSAAQPRHLGVLEEPGPCPHRLPDRAPSDQADAVRVLPAPCSGARTTTRVKKALPFAPSSRGRRAGQVAPVTPVYTPSPGDLQERQQRPRGQDDPTGGAREGQSDIDQALATSSHGHMVPPNQRPTQAAHRGIPERRLATLMVSPSMILIAIVAAYPIGYAVWLSLHESSVPRPRPCRAGPASQLRERRHQHGLAGRARHDVPPSPGTSVFLELVIGLGMALAMHSAFKGQGLLRTSSWCRGRSSPSSRDHVADDLQPRARAS
jgi:multiple sugar transport system substrate-binding protein